MITIQDFNIKKVHLLALFIVLLALFTLVPTKKANATIALNPDPGSGIPAFYRNYFMGCDALTQSPAFAPWVSVAGQPWNTNITVPYGATSISLQMNYAGAVCKSNSAVPYMAFDIQSTAPFYELTTSFNLYSIIGFIPYNAVGTYYQTATPAFIYDFGTPQYTTQDVNMTFYIRDMNIFTTGVVKCIASPNQTGIWLNFNSCPNRAVDYSIHMDVTPLPDSAPTITLAYTCNAFGTPGASYVRVTSNDPNGNPFAVSYTGTVAGSQVSSNFLIGSDPYVPFTIRATANGIYPIGNYSGPQSADTGVKTYPACAFPVADSAPTITLTDQCSAVGGGSILVTTSDPNGGVSTVTYSGTVAGSATSNSFTIPRVDPTQPFTITASTNGVYPPLPNTALKSFSVGPVTFAKCADTVTLEPTAGAITLKDDTGTENTELPTSATFTPQIKFTSSTGFTGTVSGFTVSKIYIINRGGTYDAVAGRLTGGPLSYSSYIKTPVAPVPATATATSTALDNTTGSNTVPLTNLGTPFDVLQKGDNICLLLAISPADGTVDASGSIKVKGTTLVVYYSCTQVTDRPYLRTYGADLVAGGGFGDNCSSTPANISAFSNTSASGKAGSGSQLGVFASGTISGFLSMSLANAVGTTAVTSARTFSSAPGFGGSFGTKYCSDDLWTNTGTLTTTTAGLNTLANGTYSYPAGAANATGVPTVIGNKIAIYVNGDVTINSNITYASPGSWASVSAIPSFYLVVKGNIYIAPGVTQLDGYFIAQDTSPSTTKGRIFTCTDGTNNPTAAYLAANCGSQLRINGSFVAEHVNFLRTYKTLRNSVTGELSSVSNSAEVFEYSPEQLISTPAIAPINTTGKFDSIVSLPPQL